VQAKPGTSTNTTLIMATNNKRTRSFGGHRATGMPLQSWPRQGGPPEPDGPIRFADGPSDVDGLARESFWDQTPEERRTALAAMVGDAGIKVSEHDPSNWSALSERRTWARAWLNELDRARQHISK